MRQTIATARRDVDLLVGLEKKKQPHMQDTLGGAAQFLQAGRVSEALDWVWAVRRLSNVLQQQNAACWAISATNWLIFCLIASAKNPDL